MMWRGHRGVVIEICERDDGDDGVNIEWLFYGDENLIVPVVKTAEIKGRMCKAC